MLRILALACVVFLFVSCSGASSNRITSNGLDGGTSFGSSWNTHCGTYNFDSNVDVTPFTTLGDMYNGSDFTTDIESMDDKISADLGESSGLEGASGSALYIWFDEEDPT